MMVIKVLKEIATFYLDTQEVEKANNALNLMYLDIKATEDHNINLLGYKSHREPKPRVGHPFFSKERSVLSVLFCSL